MDAGTVSSWVAALIAFGSLTGTWVLRRRDHPEADLVLASHSMHALSKKSLRDIGHFAGFPTDSLRPFAVAVANDGDGPAHRVTFDGDGIDRAIPVTPDPADPEGALPWSALPRLLPGEVIFVFVWPTDPDVDRSTVSLHARWRTSPTRHRRDDECWIKLGSMPLQGRLPQRRVSKLLARIRE